MAKLVVVGAGLGGLYTALQLINKGVNPEKLILIDPRAGHYTRPGHLDASAFDEVQSNTGLVTTSRSTADHIKELERMLYNKLVSMKVKFVTESFVDLQQTDNQHWVVVTDSNGYPADFVFDCTGKTGQVIQAVNRHQQAKNLEPAYVSSPLVNTNPISHHLVAQVIIPNAATLIDFVGDVAIVGIPSTVKMKSHQQVIAIKEQLQALGWEFEAFPTFYTFPQIGKNKLCLYMETPPNLPLEQQSNWIKLLLTIYSKGQVTDYTELKPSVKYPKKPRIVGFKSEPHVLNRVAFQLENLTVLAGFDALKGSDYRLAHGVISGIQCCELALKNITINNENIQHIDLQAINEEVLAYIQTIHKKTLETTLNNRQQAIERSHDYFSKIYKEAAKLLPESERIKKQKYQRIATELAYQNAKRLFAALKLTEDPLINLLALNNCLSTLLDARALPANNTQEHQVINTQLVFLIKGLRSEIMNLQIEPFITQRPNNVLLARICSKIIENFEHLEGALASITIKKRAQQILDCINSKKKIPTTTINIAKGANQFSFLPPLSTSSEGIVPLIQISKTTP